MLCIKLMSGEEKSDSDQSKFFKMIVCDNHNFGFAKDGDGKNFLVLTPNHIDDMYSEESQMEESLMYEAKGNVYVMQNGKTIATLKFNEW